MKGWLDNYGKEANANEGHSSAPKEWMGEGYSNIGRSYSPAWGGQFAMGGSLPGSVGFMYARTNSPAPSNGPYAKKTKASAQDGKTIHPINLHLPKYEAPKPFFTGYGFSQNPAPNVDVYGVGAYGTGNINDRLNLSGNVNSASVFYPGGEKMFMNPRFEVGMKYKFNNGGSMTYYQNGLDWKPKSISKNGDDVPKNQNAQFVLPRYVMPRFSSESVSSGIQKRDVEKEDALARRQVFEKLANQPSIGPAPFQTIDDKRKTKEKKKQLVQNNPNIKLDENDDIVLVNPDRGWEGQPLTPNAKRWDKGMSQFMNAIEATSALTGAGQIGSNLLRLGASQLEKKIGRNLISRNLKNFTSKVNPTLNAIDEAGAYVQLDPIGIMGNRLNSRFYNPTTSLNTANNTVTGVKNNLTNSAIEGADLIIGENNLKNITLPKITPEQWKEMSGYLGRRQFVKGLQKEGLVGKEFNLGDVNYAARSTGKTDALTKLALERKHTGFRNVSGELPYNGKGFQNYSGYSYDMNKPAFGQTISEVDNMMKAEVDFTNPQSIAEYQATHIPLDDYGYRSTGEHSVPEYGFLFRNPIATSSKQYGNFQFKSAPNLNFGSGNYKDWFKKYYEDLKYHRGNPNFSGGPSRKDNLQDLMFWTKTNEPSVSGATLVGPRGTKAFEIDKSFPFTNMDKLNSEQSQNLKNYIQEYNKQYNTGWRGQYKQGGVVKDNNGYWNPDNWGKVVEIDSPDITMEGVDQDLIGISDEGDVQYMTPGKDYKFKGKKVREYPVGKNGVNQQDEKVDEQLDQLINFSNYNTSEKGGWLDNYQ